MAYRGRDRRRRQARGGHLVQQRLKQVMITAVDYGDFDRFSRKRLGGFKSTEAATDYDHAWQ
jgi:hypothetical protein